MEVKRNGSREEVWKGLAQQTKGGLRKDDLILNSKGKIVSKLMSERAKANYPKLLEKICKNDCKNDCKITTIEKKQIEQKQASAITTMEKKPIEKKQAIDIKTIEKKPESIVVNIHDVIKNAISVYSPELLNKPKKLKEAMRDIHSGIMSLKCRYGEDGYGDKPPQMASEVYWLQHLNIEKMIKKYV